MTLFRADVPGTMQGAVWVLWTALATTVVLSAVIMKRTHDIAPFYDWDWSGSWYAGLFLSAHALSAWRIPRMELPGFVFVVGFLCFLLEQLFLTAWVAWRSSELWPMLALPALQLMALGLLLAPSTMKEMRRRIAATREP